MRTRKLSCLRSARASKVLRLNSRNFSSASVPNSPRPASGATNSTAVGMALASPTPTTVMPESSAADPAENSSRPKNKDTFMGNSIRPRVTLLKYIAAPPTA
jgi:hypothetical protein